MKKALLFSLLVVASASAAAQCTMQIFPAPGHIKITANQTINATEGVYWICSGLTVTVASSEGTLFLLESNVTLNITDSAGDQLAAKPGCVINNNSDTDIGVICNSSTVELNNNGSGSLIVDVECANVVFDYGMVGGPGTCGTTTSISQKETQQITIGPNPFSSELKIIALPAGTKVRLMSMLGETIGTWQPASEELKIATDGLPSGIYFLITENNGLVITKKLVRE